jgi:hypothetical protein
MRSPAFPSPAIYTALHRIQFALLPPPLRYTPTQAPGYWIETTRETGTIARLAKPPPFPMQKAVVNGMYMLDCLMVGPGALALRTPSPDEFEPWFYRVDFEQIFGHRLLGVSKQFPMKYIPNSYVLATNVKPFDPLWEPSEHTKGLWAKYGLAMGT